MGSRGRVVLGVFVGGLDTFPGLVGFFLGGIPRVGGGLAEVGQAGFQRGAGVLIFLDCGGPGTGGFFRQCFDLFIRGLSEAVDPVREVGFFFVGVVFDAVPSVDRDIFDVGRDVLGRVDGVLSGFFGGGDGVLRGFLSGALIGAAGYDEGGRAKEGQRHDFEGELWSVF